MKQTASMGHNCTGIASSEGRADEMQREMDQFAPSSRGTSEGPGKVRVLYAKDSAGEGLSLGSVPPPPAMAGKAKAAIEKFKGHEPTLLMDKMGERLAFERGGTRLYEALISKHEAYGGFDGGPSRRQLLELLNEEHGHFALLTEAMEELGGDPTAMTPSADLGATASEGVVRVITDPRTTLLQCLEAILVAELTDREGWEVLIELTRNAGEDQLVSRFEAAQQTEEEHLSKVRAWLRAGQGRANSGHAAE